MRTTIDAAGRVVIPKALRDAVGLAPGTELDIDAVDGRVEITIPSRVRVDEGRYGPRLVADDAAALTTDEVRALLDQGRR